MTHELKAWPGVYQDHLDGLKPWALRKDDRGYEVGDILHVREWDPETSTYTGRDSYVRVRYILRGDAAEAFGCKPGYCIMTIGSIT